MAVVQAPIDTLSGVRDSMRDSGDPRASRTRQAILDAVERLGTSDDEVTVSGIVREAGISRSSFYTHFAGIDELAVVLLARAFDEMSRSDLDRRQEPGITGAQAARDAAVQLVRHLDTHRGLYVAVFGLPTTSRAFTRAVELYAAHARQSLDLVQPERPAVEMTATATYIAGGTLTLLGDWLRSDDPVDIAEIVELLVGLLPSWLADERSSRTTTGTKKKETK